jgi:Ser/Thr protein kinase RdoA (MazF antagonist)
MTDTPTAVLSADERAAAEAVLARAWDGPVSIGSATVVAGRHHVVRLTAADGRTAVLKRSRAPGDSGWGGEPDGLAVEWAVLDHLTSLGSGIAPALLGGDDAQGIVVLEDLPEDRSLADSLVGGDPVAAEADLVAFATALGRMHVATLGSGEALAAARRRRGLDGSSPGWWPGRLSGARPRLRAELVGLGMETAGVEAELDEVGDMLATSYAGLVHGDPCPDNTLFTGGRCRLIDFERSSLGSVVLDAGYLLAPFPSCWCFGRLPEAATTAALAAYEHVLTGAGVGLGDAWERALAAALGLWAAARLTDHVTGGQRERVWGTTTVRPRLAAWTASFLSARGAAAFPHLTAAVQRWRDALGLDDVPVPGYPALAT